MYNLHAGIWSSPASGIRPPPCSNFSLTMIDDHRAALFGGSVPDKESTNHMYLIDLANMVSK